MKMLEPKVKPLLRWAGGKHWLINRIKYLLPEKIDTYHEPFLGGASMFLNINRNATSYLSDSNPELITFYSQVKNNLNNLIQKLKPLKNTEKEYYKVRASKPRSDLGVAARFYYLNRTCFNGLYRVNQEGVYNVPYGYRNINFIDLDGLKFLNGKLESAVLTNCDFSNALKKVKKNDFVFLDPPYTVAHNKNGFIEYNQNIFSWEDQHRLAISINRLIEKKAFFIMTNACHDSIKKLYAGVGKHFEIERFSTISGKTHARFKISEIIITNCV